MHTYHAYICACMRQVIRVEISIDGGETWTLSNLTHPEQPTE